MRYPSIMAAAIFGSGCLGLGLRSDLDDEPQVGWTRVTVESAMPGARATLDSMEIVLADGSGEGVVDPPLGIDAFTLELEHDGARVALDVSVAGHYEAGGIDPDAALASVQLVVHALRDGTCVAATQSGVAEGGNGWAGDPVTVPEPCGPWATAP
jgi:hypothetical protein